MMNQTTLIRELEIDLGYKFTDLEIDHDEIINIIKLKTLPTFSKYFPYQTRITIDAQKDLVPGYNNRYYLRADTDIMNVNRLVTNNAKMDASGSGLTGAAMRPGYDYGLSNFFERQIQADLASASNPVTFMFYPPNQIEIYPSFIAGLVELNVVHDITLHTVPMNMKEYFMQLALADVKTALYQIRNRFNNMQTSFGTLDLFIDELQSGKDERNELIEKFKNASIKTARRKKLWIR